MSWKLRLPFATTPVLPVQVGLLALILSFLPGCGQPKDLITVPILTVSTPAERREALDALRNAWYSRPGQISPEQEKAERHFLNRLISFVQHSRGKEIYGDACRLWNVCYHDHVTRYGGTASASGQP